MENKNFYIIDSCSLIDLNRHTPIDVFPSLWKKMGELIIDSNMVSHNEVFNEITQQDDALSKWVKKYKKMFEDVTLRQTELVNEISKKYPSFVKIDKPYDADPWLIALAKEIQENPQRTLLNTKRLVTVITEESSIGNKIKIPSVCKYFGIKCINCVEMFRQESWKF